jgi:hypothetical protein
MSRPLPQPARRSLGGSRLASELLVEITSGWGAAHAVGATPNGDRRIRYLDGGTFRGPRLEGEVLPGGGDWVLLRPDGTRTLDVRATLRTDDGHLIYLVSRGIFDVAPATFERLLAGEEVDPSEYYLRLTPVFETASEPYGWLNRLVAVSVGRFTATAVHQVVYAVL